MLALLIALGGASYSATGGNFILGQVNVATNETRLSAPFNGRTLRLINTSTQSQATALSLLVGAGRTPFTVNSSIKVDNLNADFLDGLDSAAFARSTSEGWHYIGASGEPPFDNGWGNYDSDANPNGPGSVWRHGSYRIDQNGVVHLGGLVAGGTLGGDENGVVFTLEGQYCPHHFLPFPVLSNNTLGRVTVKYDLGSGCAVNVDTGSNVWVALDGISYQTAAREVLVAPPPVVNTSAVPMRRRLPR